MLPATGHRGEVEAAVDAETSQIDGQPMAGNSVAS